MLLLLLLFSCAEVYDYPEEPKFEDINIILLADVVPFATSGTLHISNEAYALTKKDGFFCAAIPEIAHHSSINLTCSGGGTTTQNKLAIDLRNDYETVVIDTLNPDGYTHIRPLGKYTGAAEFIKQFYIGDDTLTFLSSGLVKSSKESSLGKWYFDLSKAIIQWSDKREQLFVHNVNTSWYRLDFHRNMLGRMEYTNIETAFTVPTLTIQTPEAGPDSTRVGWSLKDWNKPVDKLHCTLYWCSPPLDTATALKKEIEYGGDSEPLHDLQEGTIYEIQLVLRDDSKKLCAISPLLSIETIDTVPPKVPFSTSAINEKSVAVSIESQGITDFDHYTICYKRTFNSGATNGDISDWPFSVTLNIQDVAQFKIEELEPKTEYYVALFTTDKTGNTTRSDVQRVTTRSVGFDRPNIRGSLVGSDSLSIMWSPYIGRDFLAYELRYVLNTGIFDYDKSRVAWRSEELSTDSIAVGNILHTKNIYTTKLVVIRTDGSRVESNQLLTNTILLTNATIQEKRATLYWRNVISFYQMYVYRQDDPAEKFKLVGISYGNNWTDSLVEYGSTYTYLLYGNNSPSRPSNLLQVVIPPE